MPTYVATNPPHHPMRRSAGGTFDAYFNVQNLGNEQPPIFTNAAGSIGLNYPTLRTEDRMGRYFTIGVRAKF